MAEPLVRLVGLRVTVPGRRRKERRVVVDGLSLHIMRGEAFGLVGESGSGKSMTARSILRLMAPGVQAAGEIWLGGENVLAMNSETLRRTRAERVAMIYQDPRVHINPVHTVGDFVTEGMRARGVSARAAEARAVRLLSDVQIPDAGRRLRQYPHELSGGLLQRVVIASALAQDPDLILADEPTTALDVITQSEVMTILDELRRERGLTMLFITHDLELAASTCDRTAVMYAGRIVETQESRTLHSRPLHPYTSGLMMSRPDIDIVQPRLSAIPGQAIAAYEAEGGCAFAPRCAYRIALCETDVPAETMLGEALVACHRATELASTLPHTVGGPADA